MHKRNDYGFLRCGTPRFGALHIPEKRGMLVLMTIAAESGKPLGEVVANVPRQATKGPLDRSELARRLALGSPKLVEELWTVTQKQLEVEVARHGRLDAKATSLLTAAGLSLTVAFTFGSTLLKEAKSFDAWHIPIILIFGVTIICGLMAAFNAVHGLALREQLGVNEEAIFDPEALKEADAEETAEAGNGVMEYRKGRIIHFWTIRQRYWESYQHKAKIVKHGQYWFLAFLACLLVLCVFNVLACLFA